VSKYRDEGAQLKKGVFSRGKKQQIERDPPLGWDLNIEKAIADHKGLGRRKRNKKTEVG